MSQYNYTTTDLHHTIEQARRAANRVRTFALIHKREPWHISEDLGWDAGFVAGRLSIITPNDAEERLHKQAVENEARFLLRSYVYTR